MQNSYKNIDNKKHPFSFLTPWNGVVQSRRENTQDRLGTRIQSQAGRGLNGSVEQACNTNCVTKNQVGAGRGFGGSSASTTARQCPDQIPTWGEVDQGDQHALQSGLKVIGTGGGYQAPGKYHHNLERGGRMAGWRRNEIWNECGKFQNHGGGGNDGM